MIRILIDNNKSRILGDRILVEELADRTKVRVKNAWFAMRNGWDGFVRYVSTETGSFSTGLLPMILDILKKEKISYELEDKRAPFKDMHEVTKVGDLTLRDYQQAALHAVLNNKVKGFRFQRGILHEATNAGKNLIAAAIFQSFSKKRKGLFLIDEKEIFDQAVEELTELMGDEVGYISSKKTMIRRINVCMIPTLNSRISRDPKLKALLAQQDIVIYDEVDKSANGRGKRILGFCYNATVRIGLSGTPFMSKDKVANQNLLAYFGPVLHKMSNREMVAEDHSTEPDIRFYMGNKLRIDDYQEEYQKGIIDNKARHKKIWKLVMKFKRHMPCLIMFKNHAHGRNLLKACPEQIRETYKVEMVHGQTPNRKQILADFKEGRIDILICSMIVRRGKNIKKTRMMINAAGGDSVANVLQLLGRLLRKDDDKKKVMFLDFYDYGEYLQRHSKHRLIALKNEKFEVPVKELYKGKLKTIIKYEREKRTQKRPR